MNNLNLKVLYRTYNLKNFYHLQSNKMAKLSTFLWIATLITIFCVVAANGPPLRYYDNPNPGKNTIPLNSLINSGMKHISKVQISPEIKQYGLRVVRQYMQTPPQSNYKRQPIKVTTTYSERPKLNQNEKSERIQGEVPNKKQEQKNEPQIICNQKIQAQPAGTKKNENKLQEQTKSIEDSGKQTPNNLKKQPKRVLRNKKSNNTQQIKQNQQRVKQQTVVQKRYEASPQQINNGWYLYNGNNLINGRGNYIQGEANQIKGHGNIVISP